MAMPLRLADAKEGQGGDDELLPFFSKTLALCVLSVAPSDTMPFSLAVALGGPRPVQASFF
jgi:hypothetical protein